MDAATFATAYGLSTSAGLRPFLALAFASLAMHFGYLHPAPAFAYLGTNGATLVLAALAGLEFVADKIPVVDHTLHAVHFALKPVVAAILVGGALPHTGLAPDATMAAAALTALGIHSFVATTRGASTATTLGLANPAISLVEDAFAIVAAIVAFVLPFVAAALALVSTIVAVVLARKAWRAVRYGLARSRANGNALG